MISIRWLSDENAGTPPYNRRIEALELTSKSGCMAEGLKAPDCKSGPYSRFGGSNPSAPTKF